LTIVLSPGTNAAFALPARVYRACCAFRLSDAASLLGALKRARHYAAAGRLSALAACAARLGAGKEHACPAPRLGAVPPRCSPLRDTAAGSRRRRRRRAIYA